MRELSILLKITSFFTAAILLPTPREIQKTSTSASLTNWKPLIVRITINYGKILEMEILNRLTCLQRNLNGGQEPTVRSLIWKSSILFRLLLFSSILMKRCTNLIINECHFGLDFVHHFLPEFWKLTHGFWMKIVVQAVCGRDQGTEEALG